ncbi:MAG: Fe-S cluster assembly protein SufD [Dysgonamonadaceae bacterium]|jgi:Fe-S cluster assembly protein SufD|nr:Fe-S cluster assembly protein SufD [Dysgonamonadaceae bacterium]
MRQYIDFFNAQRPSIEKISSELMNAYRDAACKTFVENGFPAFNTEAYRHTDIPTLLSSDFGFNLVDRYPDIDPYQSFKCSIPNLSTNMYFMINDRFYRRETGHKPLPENIFSGSMQEFTLRYPEIFRKYYGKLAATEKAGLAAFNTMFVQDGYVLYIPKNVVLDKPIQVTNILRGKVDSLINRRFLIIVEAGAQAKLLLCDHTADEAPTLAVIQVSEIYVDENAVFDFYELEESSDNTLRFNSVFLRQAAATNVMINSITLSNGITRNNYHVALDGSRSETDLYGLAIVDKSQQIDNHTNIEHHAPHSKSNELFKYVLDDQAKGAFSGRIAVAQDAQKTQAYQNNRNLCCSADARMFSKPQLEIYADDVKCSHGMTTGQLDEAALFYMRSRGIAEEEARLLLKYAFTDDIIEGIRMDALRERLKILIDKRFRGELITCRKCL